MITDKEGRTKEFANILDGFWDKELPNLFPMPSQEKIEELMKELAKKNDFSLFKFSTGLIDNHIKEMVGVKVSQDVKNGSEPSFYYSFKNGGSLRQMGILNFFMYIAFVHNITYFKNDFFIDKYLRFPYYERSLSPIFANTDFYITYDFYGEPFENYAMNFLVGIFGFDMMKEKTNKEESSFIYSLHIDLSNFYPNIYTHLLERLGKSFDTFSTYGNPQLEDFFYFLDKYNQQTYLSQTKGIVPGPFSSTLCAELLMCEIDKQIVERIIKGNKIGYLRNVDDMTFYSDSKESLEFVYNKIQIILGEYKLSINDNKTKFGQCAFEYEESMLSDLNRIVEEFCSGINNVSSLENFKARIGQSIKNKQYTLAKGILTRLKTYLVDNDITIEEPVRIINYLIKLSLTERFLGSRCLKLIDYLMDCCNENDLEQVVNELKTKLYLVNSACNNSVIQIWFYYLINKHSNRTTKLALLNEYDLIDSSKNPLVLATFVEDGNGCNKKLFEIIKRGIKTGSSAFFTKYGLTLICLYSKDKHNYYSYLKHKPKLLSFLYGD